MVNEIPSGGTSGTEITTDPSPPETSPESNDPPFLSTVRSISRQAGFP